MIDLILDLEVQRYRFKILIRLRFQKVALSAIIAKMYCQTLLDKSEEIQSHVRWNIST